MLRRCPRKMRRNTPIWIWILPLLVILTAAATTPVRAAGRGSPAAVSLKSPVGSWKTVDDKTGQVKAIVKIREQNGAMEGRIVKLFHPPVSNPKCIQCTGALRDEPVMGMRILWGMRKAGDEWTGGYILDPETGRIYRCAISLENGGETLRVRGYIGFSIFGRTEKWLRMEPKD